MTTFLDKLNLRPGERRLVIGAAVVVLGFLYAWFVYPRFAEWQKLDKKREDLESTLARYQKEITRTAEYQKGLAELKKRGNPVDAEKQAIEMQRTITSQAAMNGVGINGYTAGRGPATTGGKTNAFFEEQTGTITFVAEENALVNFLYALSSGESLIRVASMTINPDPSRMRLMGNITLVASYPKRAASKEASPAAPRPTAPVATGPKPPGTQTGPKSISAALAAGNKPPATNAPTSPSWWSKVTGWFSKPTAPAQPAATNAPTRAGTNFPPKRKP
jgi:hypothetical protein